MSSGRQKMAVEHAVRRLGNSHSNVHLHLPYLAYKKVPDIWGETRFHIKHCANGKICERGDYCTVSNLELLKRSAFAG